MTDDFDRRWMDFLMRGKWPAWVDTIYALIGLTRLGERSTTVEQLAAVLDRPQEETIELAWQASRVRPDEEGRIHLTTPFAGGPSRRRVYVGKRELAVSGCAPDLFQAAVSLDVPFRVEDTCSITDTPIRVEFTPAGVERGLRRMRLQRYSRRAPSYRGGRRAWMRTICEEPVCVNQNLFSSEEGAAAWAKEHKEAGILSVADTFRALEQIVGYGNRHLLPSIGLRWCSRLALRY